MKRCSICKKREARIHFPFNPSFFCEECFQDFLEHKLLRNIREYKLLKNKKIIIKEDNSIEKKITIFILKKFFSKSNKIEITDKKDNENINTKTVEEVSSKFIESLVENTELYLPPEKNLLHRISIFEIEKYAKINKISYEERNFGKIYKKLEKIYIKQPSLFFSIYKSALDIQKRKNKRIKRYKN